MTTEPNARAPEPTSRILVVDDEESSRRPLLELLRDAGYAVEAAGGGAEALELASSFAPDLVLSDLKMPGMDGLELLRKLKEAGDEAPAVIMMTGFGEVATAVEAMKEGAAHYLTKPLDGAELQLVIGRELERTRLRREAARLRERLSETYRFHGLIGSSPSMQELFKTIVQVAGSRATVLIRGESGTGKELVAGAIHARSPRAQGPLVKLHCGALAESLLESELFGHEKGSFTGAVARREGRFEQAHGGTLFLDEIGEISPTVQVKLLRFLQEHEFERVGGNQTIRVDVRIIAATNRDLKAEVAKGRFREDLYYRLAVVELEIPPLRARRSDIPVLAMHLLEKHSPDSGKTLDGFTEEAIERLVSHAWPGNVRELENVIGRAAVMSNGPRVSADDLPASVAGPDPEVGIAIPGATLEAIERFAILKTLEATGGSTKAAAEMLGISARSIQYKLHEVSASPRSGVSAVEGGDEGAETEPEE